MKKIIKIVLAMNVLIWSVLSIINYIGIMEQFKDDIIRIFLWSIFIVIMYGVVIYSITMEIHRILLICQYRNNKLKYISNKAFIKQNVLLGLVIIYLYGICYYNSQFIGLLPMFLFFSNILTDMGRFYVYDNQVLIMIEDISKEYLVKEFNLSEQKLFIQENDRSCQGTIEVTYKMDAEEIKFLSDYLIKDTDKMEVA